MKSSKQSRLLKVGTDIVADGVCRELADQAKNLVLGAGKPDADIVFIGEAPGKAEDEQALPFVGASGRFLNEMLAAAKLERGDVYITNIVKYRPPNNRDPSHAEKQAFWPYLARQLDIIEPKVIVTLGRHSMEFFLPHAKIGEVHGTAVRKPVRLPSGTTREWTIVPLYHPAAALYNGSLRQTIINDFLTISRLPERDDIASDA